MKDLLTKYKELKNIKQNQHLKMMKINYIILKQEIKSKRDKKAKHKDGLVKNIEKEEEIDQNKEIQ